MSWRQRKKTWYGCLIIFEAFIASYVLIVAYDCPVSLFNINPPPAPTVITIPLTIPPTIPSTGQPFPGVYVAFTLRANGIIAEGVQVQLAAASGWIVSHDYYVNFWEVSIFFQDSVPWSLKNSTNLRGYGSPSTWIGFTRDIANPSDINLLPSPPPYDAREIYFPVAGDYYSN